MSAPRTPPQLTDVKAGMWLKFIRPVQDGNVYLSKGSGPTCRTCYILEDDGVCGDGLVLVVFKSRIRNVFGQPVAMLEQDGFKYCRYVRKQLLIDNCKEVDPDAC